MYQFKFSLNDDDYFEFNKYHMFNAPASKKSLAFSKLLFPILLAVILLLMCLGDSDRGMILFMAVFYIIASIVWIVFFKKIYTVFLARKLKRFKKVENLPYGQEVELEFEEDHFTEKLPGSESKSDYSRVMKIVTDKQAIYVYVSAIQALIIPFRVFENPSDRVNFLNFLHEKTSH